MFKNIIMATGLILSLSACSTFNTTQKFDKPENLLFINKEIDSLPLQVQRDEKLCENEKKDDQTCPIKFYINDFKAGDFYTNNTATYYLKPAEYVLTVKNCKEKCDTFHTKINVVNELPNVNLILSIDHEGRPFITNKKS